MVVEVVVVVVKENNRNVLVVMVEENNGNVVVVLEEKNNRNVVVVVYSFTIHEAVFKKKLSVGSMWDP